MAEVVVTELLPRPVKRLEREAVEVAEDDSGRFGTVLVDARLFDIEVVELAEDEDAFSAVLVGAGLLAVEVRAPDSTVEVTTLETVEEVTAVTMLVSVLVEPFSGIKFVTGYVTVSDTTLTTEEIGSEEEVVVVPEVAGVPDILVVLEAATTLEEVVALAVAVVAGVFVLLPGLEEETDDDDERERATLVAAVSVLISVRVLPCSDM